MHSNYKKNNLIGYVFGKTLPIYHIIEYPKCGGTWLMRLLRSCYNQETTEGKEILAGMSERFYKRHVLPKGYVQRPILIVRDPRDVWVSFYFHVVHLHRNKKVRAEIGYSEAQPDAECLEKFVRLYIEKPERYYPFFTYEDLVNAWQDKMHNAGVLVKYEDMQVDTLTVLKKISDRYSLGISEKTMRDAIEKNTFRKLAGREKGEMDSSSHKRKGIVGDWKNYFSDKLLEYVFDQQRDLFKILNYPMS
jgi:hypothetical protein